MAWDHNICRWRVWDKMEKASWHRDSQCWNWICLKSQGYTRKGALDCWTMWITTWLLLSLIIDIVVNLQLEQLETKGLFLGQGDRNRLSWNGLGLPPSVRRGTYIWKAHQQNPKLQADIEQTRQQNPVVYQQGLGWMLHPKKARDPTGEYGWGYKRTAPGELHRMVGWRTATWTRCQ